VGRPRPLLSGLKKTGSIKPRVEATLMELANAFGVLSQVQSEPVPGGSSVSGGLNDIRRQILRRGQLPLK
jgi:hypothetical protein